MKEIEATIDGITYEIEYEYDITDEVLCHLRKLIKYFDNFNKDDVFVWVPGSADDECEFGVHPDPNAEYSQCGGFFKMITLTRGDEVSQAFGNNWDEEHISHACISWAISKEEHCAAIAEYESMVERHRLEMAGCA